MCDLVSHNRHRHDPVPHPGAPGVVARLCPRTIQSGTRARPGKAAKGNPYLKGVLGDAAAAAGKTFLGERYRRLAKRIGKLKALVAVARSILVIVWVRREALSLRMEVRDRPSPRRRSGGVKLEEV